MIRIRQAMIRIRQAMIRISARKAVGRLLVLVPEDPLRPVGLFRFKAVLFFKGYRSQSTLEREIYVDKRGEELCGLEDSE
jgi:hypothetical protein